MNRTQHWCDACGRLVEDKRVPKGTLDFTSETWEIWSPKDNQDWVFCSLLCLYHHAGNMLMAQDVKEANEGN